MARQTTSPSVRLRKLAAVTPRVIELPYGTILKLRDMAAMLGVSTPTLRGWCDTFPAFEESGAFERGAEGIEYEFCPVRTIWFLTNHFRGQVRSDQSGIKRLARLAIGENASRQVPEDLSLDDIQKLLRVSTGFQDQKQRQGELVDAVRMRAVLERTFSAIQQAALRAVQEADPTGQMPAEQRMTLEDVSRSILLNQQRAAADCLKEFHGGVAQPG